MTTQRQEGVFAAGATGHRRGSVQQLRRALFSGNLMIVIDRVLILIHMQKCGGTAIADAVLREWKDEALYWGYDAEGEARSAEGASRGLLWKHSTAFEAYKFLPREVWNRTPKVFASLRPSRERLISHYAHLRSQGLSKWSFEQYLRSSSVETVEQFITDRQGKILVDHVVDFAKLEDSATAVFRTLGLKTEVFRPRNVNARKTEIMTDFAVGGGEESLMRNVCAWELERFPTCRDI